MSTYAIGDIHGCYDELITLLERIQFNESKDALWFSGDLVNRGPKSLQVLRFVKKLQCQKSIVLGNHDLHLLATAYGYRKPKPNDTLQQVLVASDHEELIDWVRQQKFLHHDESFNCVMSHAGIYPLWNLNQAKEYAEELHGVMQSIQFEPLLKNMYGDQPDHWSDYLKGFERYRFFINAFTRMRLCFEDGHLELRTSVPLGLEPRGTMPWFDLPFRKPIDADIIFGHWAALHGKTNHNNIVATDTGCVWGRQLTAVRLEDKQRFSVDRLRRPVHA